MTEAEIMKGLECCTKGGSCDECPILGNEMCCGRLHELALDLLNRKNEEIEKFADIGKMYSEIKAEAIKEFVKRLKGEHFKVPVDAYHSAYVIGDDDIDQIAKEMGVDV